MIDPSENTAPEPRYALGHSDPELERLVTQARVIDPITRRFFLAAGIAPGMRVLDVGSGMGDVSFLAAELVGTAGEVVGVDRAARASASARARASGRSLHNVSFRTGDVLEMSFERPFDAIVGRYVLQHLADPAAALRRVATHLAPGGLVVFHELDWDGVRSSPASPTYDQCCRWSQLALELGGAETHMGAKLYPVFGAAGLPPPALRLEAMIAGSANSWDRLYLAAELARTLLPTMETMGVATAVDVAIDTLATRMQSEVVANNSVIIGHWQVGAWTRLKPT
jgi:SAM-dependent methyltransferase